MKKMCPALVLVLVLTVVFSSAVFTGCGEIAGYNLTVNYFVGGYGSEWIESAKAEFEDANPGVKIKLVKDEMLETEGGAVTLLGSKNAPDIIMTLGFNWSESVANEEVEPLDEIFNADVEKLDGSSVKLKDFIMGDYKQYPWSKAAVTAQNEHAWVIPWTATSVSLAYNDDLLKKTPTSLESDNARDGFWVNPPSTEQELVRLVDDINAAAYDGKTVKPFIFPGTAQNWLTFLTTTWWAQYQGIGSERPQGEGNWYDFWDFASPDVYKQTGIVKSYELLSRLFIDPAAHSYKNIADAGSDSTVDAEKKFINGAAVMMPVGTWLENEMDDFLTAPEAYPDMKNNLRMMTLPSIEGAKSTGLNNANAGDLMLIPAKAKNKENAKAFLKFLHSERRLVDFTKSSGVMRPFEYDPLAAEPTHAWTVFQRDSIKLYTENTNFFKFSKTKAPFFVYKNLDNFQPTMISVFNNLLGAGAAVGSPQGAAQAVYAYVTESTGSRTRWEQWKNDFGL
ncbi:MAG: extracellular solute-binding protein [Clostridiales bacterium]|jgi:ABC-type glycerol-3-phosphate transport system substrate-binding protein|nr:extracellular solute-binding protein [Clostridiales bacterium]